MERSKTFAWFIVAVAAGSLVWGYSEADPLPFGDALFWFALIAAADLLPVSLGFDTEVTMAFPLHLAIAIVFRANPFYAMAIAGAAAVDAREFKRTIPLYRALFNRALMVLSVGAAALPLTIYGRDPLAHVAGVLLIILAAVLHLVTNLGLLTTAIGLSERIPIATAFRSLLPTPVTGFVVSYALLTAFGVGTAIADNIGKWAVAAILVPLMFARASILGARNQQELAERIQQQQEALLRSTERVFKEREAERNRIAAEMHDSSLQSLAAASYAAGNARDFLRNGKLEDAKEAMSKAHAATENAISELRQSLADLRRSSVLEGGLMESITRFSEQVSTLWGATIRVEGGVDREPPIPVALVALQIVQEGVTNALKHSTTNAVVVKVSEDGAMVRLEVEDDGAGFDPASVGDPAHMGVQLMQERATSVGGELRLESVPGGGTRVRAMLPAGVER